MRRDLYYKKEVRREFENFGNLWFSGLSKNFLQRDACMPVTLTSVF